MALFVKKLKNAWRWRRTIHERISHQRIVLLMRSVTNMMEQAISPYIDQTRRIRKRKRRKISFLRRRRMVQPIFWVGSNTNFGNDDDNNKFSKNFANIVIKEAPSSLPYG